MKIVIGVQTCNRLEFTKKTIESVIKYNPEARGMPWVISDDGSIDGTKKYIDGLDFIIDVNFYPEQAGITKGLERLIKLADRYGDIILYLQNDWEQIRRIDFESIQKFYKNFPNTGHIAMIVDKGADGHKRPSSFGIRLNLFTKEKFDVGDPIVMGEEKFIPGKWSYADIPGFTNLVFAKQMFDDSKLDESVRVRKIYESGCDNYLLDNQPYRNLDFMAHRSTPKRRF